MLTPVTRWKHLIVGAGSVRRRPFARAQGDIAGRVQGLAAGAYNVMVEDEVFRSTARMLLE